MDIRKCCACPNDIDPERAEVLPDTELCTDCAKKIGKFGGEFNRSHAQENLGKTGSFKKTYGGVNVSKQRNYAAIERLKDENAKASQKE